MSREQWSTMAVWITWNMICKNPSSSQVDLRTIKLCLPFCAGIQFRKTKHIKLLHLVLMTRAGEANNHILGTLIRKIENESKATSTPKHCSHFIYWCLCVCVCEWVLDFIITHLSNCRRVWASAWQLSWKAINIDYSVFRYN